VGALIVPFGVYVTVPEAATDTGAVLFVVVLVLTETFPCGVKFPVEEKLVPVKVG
jgi:hypothetical protein